MHPDKLLTLQALRANKRIDGLYVYVTTSAAEVGVTTSPLLSRPHACKPRKPCLDTSLQDNYSTDASHLAPCSMGYVMQGHGASRLYAWRSPRLAPAAGAGASAAGAPQGGRQHPVQAACVVQGAVRAAV